MFSGKVSLEILNASNLPDECCSLNTFIKVKVDDTDVFQTETVKRTSNPIWNEYTEFEKKNAKHIIFSIHNDDREKQMVADCKLSLYDLLLKQIGRGSIKLKQSLNPQGELEVYICLNEAEKVKEQKQSHAGEKIHRVLGHNFAKVHFSSLTYCSLCSKFLWGLGKQGMRCLGCHMAVHDKCHKLVLNQCPAEAKLEVEGEREAATLRLEMPHNFVRTTYLSPTFCDHDGTLLSGFFKQGYKCKSCPANVHEGCRKLVSSPCGVDKHTLALMMSNQNLDRINHANHQDKAEKDNVLKDHLLRDNTEMAARTEIDLSFKRKNVSDPENEGVFDMDEDWAAGADEETFLGFEKQMALDIVQGTDVADGEKRSFKKGKMISPSNESDQLDDRTAEMHREQGKKERENIADTEANIQPIHFEEDKDKNSRLPELLSSTPIIVIEQVTQNAVCEGHQHYQVREEVLISKTGNKISERKHTIRENSELLKTKNQVQENDKIPSLGPQLPKSQFYILEQPTQNKLGFKLINADRGSEVKAAEQVVHEVPLSTDMNILRPWLKENTNLIADPDRGGSKRNAVRRSRVSDLINMFEDGNVERGEVLEE